MDTKNVEDIMKHYQEQEQNFMKTDKNVELIKKDDEINKKKLSLKKDSLSIEMLNQGIKDKEIELNRNALHRERLEKEMEQVTDSKLKAEYKKKLEETDQESQTIQEEVKRLKKDRTSARTHRKEEINTELEKLQEERQEMITEKRQKERVLREEIYKKVNDLQDSTRKELMQLKKETDEKLLEIEMMRKTKQLEMNNFSYVYDENGNPTNGEDFKKINEDITNLIQQKYELQETSKKCEIYRNSLIDPFKMPPELPDDQIYTGDFMLEQKSPEEKPQENNNTATNNSNDFFRDLGKLRSSIENNPKHKISYPLATLETMDKVEKEIKEKLESNSEETAKKIEYVEISEKDGTIYWKDNKGNDKTETIKDAFESKKLIFKNLDIAKKCKEIAGGFFRGLLLRRKVNPEIVIALEKNPEQLKDYISSLHTKKDLPFELIHNLQGISILEKFRRNKFARTEKRLGAKVLGKLFDKNETLSNIENQLPNTTQQPTTASEPETQKETKAKNFDGIKVYNADNHIEKNANNLDVEQILAEERERTKASVQSIRSHMKTKPDTPNLESNDDVKTTTPEDNFINLR